MKIRFFAHLQTEAGCAELSLPAGNGITGDELWLMLDEKIPGIIRHKKLTRLARNHVYAIPGEIFRSGDEVALIPPVSGG